MDLLTTFAKISANLPNILIKSRSADVDTGIPWDKEVSYEHLCRYIS